MGWVADHCPLAPLAQKLGKNGLQVLFPIVITDLEDGWVLLSSHAHLLGDLLGKGGEERIVESDPSRQLHAPSSRST